MQRKNIFILLGILALGLGLRLFILSQRGSLWLDEAFSVHFASMSLGQMLHYLRFENNPPLYFIFLHFWMKWFGGSDLAVRLPSLIFSLASFPLVYLIGKRLHSSTAGLFASFLLAISSFQTFYSTETRMYSLYLFLALIAAYLFITIYLPLKTHVKQSGFRSYSQADDPSADRDRRPSRSPAQIFSSFIRAMWWRGERERGQSKNILIVQGGRRVSEVRPVLGHMLLFTTLLLLIWTHITAWLIVGAFALYLFWQSRFSVKTFFILHFKFLIILVLLIFSILPWFISFLQSKFLNQSAQGWFWFIPPPRNYFLDFAEIFLVFGQEHAFIIVLISILIIALFWQAVKLLRSSPESKPSIVFLLCWLLLPLTVGFIFSMGVARYFIAVSSAFYLLLGIGFAKLTEKRTASNFALQNLEVVPFPEAVSFSSLSLNKKIADSMRPHEIGQLQKHLRWIVPMLFFFLIIPDYPSLVLTGNHQWDKLAQWIQDNVECSGQTESPRQSRDRVKNAECNELILINPHSELLPFERYYKGALPFIGLYPKDDNDDRDMRIVKTNWLSLNTKENLQRKMPEIAKDYNKIFLVTGGIDPTGRNMVPLWLWQNGWRLIKEKQFGRQSVMLLERNQK